MKFQLRLALLTTLTALVSAPAGAQTLFKCIEDGRVSYVDAKNRGSLKNCEPLSGDLPVSTISTPKPRKDATPPADFPKVSPDTQKSRDNERRKILEQELETERHSLEAARQQLAEQESVRHGDERNYQRVLDRLQPYRDRVALHERNIEAIQKELSNIR